MMRILWIWIPLIQTLQSILYSICKYFQNNLILSRLYCKWEEEKIVLILTRIVRKNDLNFPYNQNLTILKNYTVLFKNSIALLNQINIYYNVIKCSCIKSILFQGIISINIITSLFHQPSYTNLQLGKSGKGLLGRKTNPLWWSTRKKDESPLVVY